MSDNVKPPHPALIVAADQGPEPAVGAARIARLISVVPIGLAQPNERIVAYLEGLLERAKSGEIRGLVAIMELADESHDHGMVGRRAPIPLLGQLARLQHRVQVDADAAMTDNDLPKQG